MSDPAFSVCAVIFLTLAVVFLQRSAMAENSAVTAAVSGRAAPTKLEELLEITAQSLVRAEVAEHYEVIRELGRGKYGHVMLVTHRQRGKELAVPCELLCLVSSPLTRAWGGLVVPQGQAPGVAGRIPRETSRMGTSPATNHSITSSQGPGDSRSSPEHLARL